MASNSKTVSYEVFYLENGSLRQSQVLTEGILKPKRFPGVQVDISGIWPD